MYQKWTKNGLQMDYKWNKNAPKIDQKWTKNGPNIDQAVTKNGPKWTNMDQKWCKIVQHDATWCNMEQNGKQVKADVRTDVRADVLNTMMFIKCNVFNTKSELIHL